VSSTSCTHSASRPAECYAQAAAKGSNLHGDFLELRILEFGAFDVAAEEQGNEGGRAFDCSSEQLRKTTQNPVVENNSKTGCGAVDDGAGSSETALRAAHTRKSLRVKIFLKRASWTILWGGMSLKPVSLHMRPPTR
jgi:hypothetical protein